MCVCVLELMGQTLGLWERHRGKLCSRALGCVIGCRLISLSVTEISREEHSAGGLWTLCLLSSGDTCLESSHTVTVNVS